MMKLIDSHCHLDFDIFNHDRDALLARCKVKGIDDIVIPAVTAQAWESLITVCHSSTMLHLALGLHPLFIDEHSPKDLTRLKHIILQNSPCAVGEIGLDFYHSNHDKLSQIYYFSEQLKIAQQLTLPVLLHVRKAHDQVIKILKDHPVSGGIVHAFNGSIQQAEHYQKLGFVFGVGGAITHPKARKLRALFQQLPLSSIVLETDAPDMPFYQQKSPRNTPENIPHIIDTLAELHQESRDEIACATTHNSQRILNL